MCKDDSHTQHYRWSHLYTPLPPIILISVLSLYNPVNLRWQLYSSTQINTLEKLKCSSLIILQHKIYCFLQVKKTVAKQSYFKTNSACRITS